MKILITGSNGQLGNELKNIIKNGRAEIASIADILKNSEVTALDVDELDISDLGQVRKKINNLKPDVVINCAAATNVDGCESNKDFALKVNSIGPRNLAIVSEEIDAKLVQVSTDYVFSGVGNNPLTEFDLTGPVSVYGKTKLLGENYVREFSTKFFIVRTAWLYGYKGNNFVYTIRRLGKERKSINVVNDQKGNPTNANDLAYHILKLITTKEYGIYNCTGKGECTWYDFAKMIIELSEEKCEINPCTSEDYKTTAQRPKYSALDNMMLRNTIGDEMREWQEALRAFIYKLDKEKGGKS